MGGLYYKNIGGEMTLVKENHKGGLSPIQRVMKEAAQTTSASMIILQKWWKMHQTSKLETQGYNEAIKLQEATPVPPQWIMQPSIAAFTI